VGILYKGIPEKFFDRLGQKKIIVNLMLLSEES
jgi:hypothetical protein